MHRPINRQGSQQGESQSGKDMKYIGAFLDTETTGLATNDEAIEFAIALFSYDSSRDRLTVQDTYHGFREPGCEINPDAEAVHGITFDDVRGRKLRDRVVRRILKKAGFIIAHNADFDRRFVERLYPQTRKMQWFCSMNGVDWRSKGFKSKGLQQLLSAHGIAVNQKHRALDDVLGALELLAHVDPLSGQMYLAELLPHAKSSKKRGCWRWLLIAILIAGALLLILMLPHLSA